MEQQITDSPEKIKISQCMIVKDEEANIEQALSWGKAIVWEQIVVDTGSTDRTVELAQAMGAKVFHFPWIDDFAAAKNYAIEQASGDWIAFLDADEYVRAEDVEKVPHFLKQAEKSGRFVLQTALLCINSEGQIITADRMCRFFRHIPGLGYRDAVHEQLALNGEYLNEKNIVNVAEEIAIYHTGYAPEVMEAKKKRERNLRILLKELEKHPHDCHVMGCVGEAYDLIEGEDEKAEYWLRRAIQFMPKKDGQNDRNVSTFIVLMLRFYRQKNEKGMLEVYEEGRRRFKGVYDLDYILGRYYAENENFEKGAYHLQKALQVLDQYGTFTFNPVMTRDLPATWELLAVCHYQNKDLAQCVTCCVSLLNVDRARMTALELLLRAFKDENPDSVVQFLGKIYHVSQIEDRILILQGAVRANATSIIQTISKYCTSEELAILKKLDMGESD